MKTKLFLFLFLASLLSGCLNCYNRCPGTDSKIIDIYQSTQESFAWSCVIAFPQIMSDDSGDFQLYPENIITVPIGCLCFVDVICEGALDTVFWPIDFWLKKSRNVEAKPFM